MRKAIPRITESATELQRRMKSEPDLKKRQRLHTLYLAARWIGFLNDLFYGRSYIAAPAEVSIPFLLDEKPTVASAGLGGVVIGGRRV